LGKGVSKRGEVETFEMVHHMSAHTFEVRRPCLLQLRKSSGGEYGELAAAVFLSPHSLDQALPRKPVDESGQSADRHRHVV
jgi:hypothetical protein